MTKSRSGARVAANDMTQRILERLQLRIRRSKLTQSAIESRIGFSRGYLSQIFTGTVEIKSWHLLAILEVMGLEPSEFFRELFPRHRVPALESLADMAHRSEEGSLSYELTRLFASGIETFHDLRDRIERCEEALDEARDLGLIGDHPEKSPTKPRPDGD